MFDSVVEQVSCTRTINHKTLHGPQTNYSKISILDFSGVIYNHVKSGKCCSYGHLARTVQQHLKLQKMGACKVGAFLY